MKSIKNLIMTTVIVILTLTTSYGMDPQQTPITEPVTFTLQNSSDTASLTNVAISLRYSQTSKIPILDSLNLAPGQSQTIQIHKKYISESFIQISLGSGYAFNVLISGNTTLQLVSNNNIWGIRRTYNIRNNSSKSLKIRISNLLTNPKAYYLGPEPVATNVNDEVHFDVFVPITLANVLGARTSFFGIRLWDGQEINPSESNNLTSFNFGMDFLYPLQGNSSNFQINQNLKFEHRH